MTAAKKIDQPPAPNFMTENENYVSLKFSGKLDNLEQAKAFESYLSSFLEKSPKDIVVNCESLSEIGPSWLGTLVRMQQLLKKFNKTSRWILVSDSLRSFFTQQGVQNSIKISPSLQQALSDMGLAPSRAIDVNFINPFLSATIDVLKIQCGTSAKPGAPFRKDPAEKYSGDISGVIGLVSQAFNGSVVISFNEKTFLQIISRMLGENVTSITKETEDGAGELTNIIFGQAKIKLNEMGYGIKTALPSVVTGANHSVLQMTNGPRIVIPFQSDVGPFFIEICTVGAE